MDGLARFKTEIPTRPLRVFRTESRGGAGAGAGGEGQGEGLRFPHLLQRDAEIERQAAVFEPDAQGCFLRAGDDAQGEEARGVEDGVARGGGGVGSGGEEVSGGGVFEEDGGCEGGGGRGGGGGGRGGRGGWEGRFEDAQAGGEDLARGCRGRPVGGEVAFGAGEGRDRVDVDGGGDEEDALDGVGGEGGVGGGVEGCHSGAVGWGGGGSGLLSDWGWGVHEDECVAKTQHRVYKGEFRQQGPRWWAVMRGKLKSALAYLLS